MDPSKMLSLGIVIVFVGFLVVVMGSLIGSGTGGSTSAGGFILIGPIPIVFGNGPNSGMLAEIGLAITLVMVVMYLVSFFVWRSARHEDAEI
jgi:uncharacterized membrane protein